MASPELKTFEAILEMDRFNMFTYFEQIPCPADVIEPRSFCSAMDDCVLLFPTSTYYLIPKNHQFMSLPAKLNRNGYPIKSIGKIYERVHFPFEYITAETMSKLQEIPKFDEIFGVDIEVYITRNLELPKRWLRVTYHNLTDPLSRQLSDTVKLTKEYRIREIKFIKLQLETTMDAVSIKSKKTEPIRIPMPEAASDVKAVMTAASKEKLDSKKKTKHVPIPREIPRLTTDQIPISLFAPREMRGQRRRC